MDFKQEPSSKHQWLFLVACKLLKEMTVQTPKPPFYIRTHGRFDEIIQCGDPLKPVTVLTDR